MVHLDPRLLVGGRPRHDRINDKLVKRRELHQSRAQRLVPTTGTQLCHRLVDKVVRKVTRHRLPRWRLSRSCAASGGQQYAERGDGQTGHHKNALARSSQFLTLWTKRDLLIHAAAERYWMAAPLRWQMLTLVLARGEIISG